MTKSSKENPQKQTKESQENLPGYLYLETLRKDYNESLNIMDNFLKKLEE